MFHNFFEVEEVEEVDEVDEVEEVEEVDEVGEKGQTARASFIEDAYLKWWSRPGSCFISVSPSLQILRAETAPPLW